MGDTTPAPLWLITHLTPQTGSYHIFPQPACALKTKTYLQGLQFQLWADFLVHFDQAVITINEHPSLASVFYVHTKEQGECPCFFNSLALHLES